MNCLVCYPMKYWDFSMISISPLVATSEDIIFIFTVCKKRIFYEFSAKLLAQKVENVVYLSEITERTLPFRDRAADVTYCIDVMLFLHMTSGELSLTAVFFFWVDFLRFIALNAIWPHFRGAKLHFWTILYPLNTLNKIKLTQTG